MKLFKNYTTNFLRALPIAIICSSLSVILLMYSDIFNELNLLKFSLSFGLTVLIMTHLVKPFTRLVAKL